MKSIYFLSDMHLGAGTLADPRAHELRLVRWLDSIKEQAEAIYLLGDVLDYWFEYKTVVPRGFTRFFGKIAEITDSGVPVHWFIGNHDIWIFDYLPQELGVQVHRGSEVVEIAGKRFFLAHGDTLCDESRKFRLMQWVFHNRVCQRLYGAIHPRWTVGLAHAWSAHSRKNPDQESCYLGEEREHLVQFAKRHMVEHPDIDYYLFGHRHILLDLMLSRTSRIVILGDWITHFSFAQFDGTNLWLDTYEEEESPR